MHEEKNSQEEIRIDADLHTHTLASGHAYGTIDEMAASAAGRGLKMIAITDHGPRMPGAFHRYYFGNLSAVPRQLHGVEILKGVETNIQTDGSLDMPREELLSLDFVCAGLHTDAGYEGKSKKDHTRALLKAISHPLVDMITHPINRSLPCDLPEVVRQARKEDVILEINAASYAGGVTSFRGDIDAMKDLCHLALRYDSLTLSLNSDAHFHTNVGEVSDVLNMVIDAGLSAERLINSNLDKTKEFLERRDSPREKEKDGS